MYVFSPLMQLISILRLPSCLVMITVMNSLLLFEMLLDNQWQHLLMLIHGILFHPPYSFILPLSGIILLSFLLCETWQYGFGVEKCDASMHKYKLTHCKGFSKGIRWRFSATDIVKQAQGTSFGEAPGLIFFLKCVYDKHSHFK